MKKWFYIGIAGLVHGCTGTDHIADPPMTVDPRILVIPDMAAVQVGQSRRFEATYFDDRGMPLADAFIRWSVSDAEIATVDELGTVRGLGAGQVTVSASVEDVVSDPTLVNVVDDSDQVAVVRLSPSKIQIQQGGTFQLAAENKNARDEVLGETSYQWRSSNEGVATVDDAGRVSAVSPGRTTITAETEGVTSNAILVTVPGGERAGMFVPRPGSSYVCEGSAVVQTGDSGVLELVLGDDFLVSKGPALEVFLSTAAMVGPTSLKIGPLQSFSGAQSYLLPAGVEMTTYDWVIIHCVPFNVTFGFAELQ